MTAGAAHSLLVVLGVFVLPLSPSPVSREVYLMGTSATLTTFAADRSDALARLEALLEQLESTEARLSTWRDDSEISGLNASAGGGAFALSAPACGLFRELDRWNRESGGAFDPAIGALTAAWDLHGTGRLPSRSTLRGALSHSGWKQVTFDSTACTVTLPRGVTLDVGGFGKGEALDRARAAVPRDTPWLIDLGGQVAVNGIPPSGDGWKIAIAHPLRRDAPYLSVVLRNGSLSTSAGSESDLRVAGRRVGHIIDPRTGRPAPFRGSVSVWHERALVADIVSTALYVMGPKEGIRWANARGIAALFLVPGARREVTNSASDRWQQVFAAEALETGGQAAGRAGYFSTPQVNIP